MPPRSNERELGEHAASIAALSAALIKMEERHERAMADMASAHQTEIRELRAALHEISVSVNSITAKITAIRGGWKTLVALVAIAGAIGGAVMKTATWYLSLPFPK